MKNTTEQTLWCDRCPATKGAVEVMVRHSNNRRSRRMQLCQPCIEQTSYDYEVKRIK